VTRRVVSKTTGVSIRASPVKERRPGEGGGGEAKESFQSAPLR